MKANLFPLQNRGMSRDLSASKADNTYAWENHNIRVTPRDHDTLLSVTNERGTKEITLPEGYLKGELIGWNVLNNHIILFTTERQGGADDAEIDTSALSVYPNSLAYEYEGGDRDITVTVVGSDQWEIVEEEGEGDSSSVVSSKLDHIYRIDYDDNRFRMTCGDTDDDGVDAEFPVYGEALYDGDLGFSKYRPIESIVYYEAANIQKIYWVDGKHVLRFMNFMETIENRRAWDDTYFDSNRIAKPGLNVGISKTNGGNNRANGVAQYLVTYYNKHGQETGYVWVSDLVYLSPTDRGGSPDGTNANLVKLEIEGLDPKFSDYKVYSIFRSSLDGEMVAYVIADNSVPADGRAIVYDDGAPLKSTDVASLLFLGGRDVVAGTMTAKDNTLFLGDITSAGVSGYDEIEKAIHALMFEGGETFTYGTTYKASCVTFEYSDGTKGKENIELEPIGGFYAYSNQLQLTSSQIQSFKGGELYRFALVFRTPNGVSSKAFWIGDLENPLYPQMVGNIVRRPIAKCVIPPSVVNVAIAAGYVTATLMIAKADASDRRVLAQGIINPTMFNVWDRYKNRLYSYSSWITRPRHSGFAWQHFEPVHNSTSETGELQCNFWLEKEGGRGKPTPYYRTYITNGTNADGDTVMSGNLVEDVASLQEYTNYKLIYYVKKDHTWTRNKCRGGWMLLRARTLSGRKVDDQTNLIRWDEVAYVMKMGGLASHTFKHTYNSGGETIYIELIKYISDTHQDYKDFWTEQIHDKLSAYLDDTQIIPFSLFEEAYNEILWANDGEGGQPYSEYTKLLYTFNGAQFKIPVDSPASGSFDIAINDVCGRANFVWSEFEHTDTVALYGNKYRSSYGKKNLFFVDENIVTLNSPEFEHELLSVDRIGGVALRIIGVAKIANNITDYTIESGESKKAGANIVQENFSTTMPSENPDGLICSPLFSEYRLSPLDTVPEGKDRSELLSSSIDSSDYLWGTQSVWYWMYMWHKSGGIAGVRAGDGFKSTSTSSGDEEDSAQSIPAVVDNTLYSELLGKTYANLRFAYNTIYTDSANYVVYNTLDDIRQYTYIDSQYVGLNVAGSQQSYNANVRSGVNMPSNKKYPVCYSESGSSDMSSPKWFLGSNDQVLLAYKSSSHVVMSLGSTNLNNTITYRILPKLHQGSYVMDEYSIPQSGEGDGTALMSAAYIPWIGGQSDSQSLTYALTQDALSLPANTISATDRYLFIGELYKTSQSNTEYGGRSRAAVESNVFVIAGPQATLLSGQNTTLIGNQGDTYFQRWDCLKTKPYGGEEVNNVVDITSVMVETHVNIDGRYDNMRNQQLLASMDTTDFGHVNPVYSQTNDFFASNDFGDEHTVDAYRSTITWTKEKAPSADIDAWSHITLASTLNLDGDKGVCRALRRFQNSILAFQDRGIAEVLFNSRTQIATTEGVPIEIANSGKVDGKRYISNKYGCLNKWSIVEGKNGLYFVDNTNKMIGVFNGENIASLTSAAYLDIWMREHNSLDIWTPALNSNFVGYYDRVHSDVYFIGNDIKNPCIVYNEVLGAFTGFFDYMEVPMMANVGDRFVSFHKAPSGYNSLWLQNEGPYNSFFGITKPFYMIWRVQPDPYGDKIWGNLEYRADFFKVLLATGDVKVGEVSPTGGQYLKDNAIIEGDYQPDMTFNEVEVWNEYQKTGRIKMEWTGANSAESYPDVRKKFRIWRADIPRAMKNETNKYGLDRIRNPWIWLRIGMGYDKLDNTCMMQLHDINVKYYSNE